MLGAEKEFKIGRLAPFYYFPAPLAPLVMSRHYRWAWGRGGFGDSGGGGGWHRAMGLVSLPLAAPIGLSPLHVLTLCGPKRVLVVSTEPPDDLSCLTTPGVGGAGGYLGRWRADFQDAAQALHRKAQGHGAEARGEGDIGTGPRQTSVGGRGTRPTCSSGR